MSQHRTLALQGLQKQGPLFENTPLRLCPIFSAMIGFGRNIRNQNAGLTLFVPHYRRGHVNFFFYRSGNRVRLRLPFRKLFKQLFHVNGAVEINELEQGKFDQKSREHAPLQVVFGFPDYFGHS